MKTIRKIALFVALCVMAMVTVSAQEPSKVEVKVNELVKRYENVKGVESLTVTKGGGLGLVKAMFNQQFGKEFMRRVTSITIISYSDAEAAVCESLRKDLDKFISVLEEFDLSGNKDVSEKGYSRCFARRTEAGTLSDFVIAMEQDLHKMVVYMAGEIVVE